MQSLLVLSSRIADLLKRRGETIGVAESSAGGLISAALLATPGASAFFVGGGVIYTRASRAALLGITDADMDGIRASSEPYALLLARSVRAKLDTTWGLAETGATGPTGNRYGDAAGHACIAIAGPREEVMTLETATGDRIGNMRAFARTALELLEKSLG
jgi:PncC family amidohydrolase